MGSFPETYDNPPSLRSHGIGRMFDRSKNRAFRRSVHTDHHNAKIEVKFLTGTVENLTGAM